MGFFDINYWIVIGAGLLLSLWASWRVKATFHAYSQVRSRSGMTGADVARAILQRMGIHDVKVEGVAGKLTDHYDPRSKTLRLSESVYGANTVAAHGVAAHEVGHALQHAQGYGPLKFRSLWVPMAQTGGGLSMIILMVAAGMGGFHTTKGSTIAAIGLVLFSCTTLFTLITLPVEFDASKRALATLESGGILASQELDGARKVLNAAALTYVAAFVTSLLTLLYYAWRLGLFGQSRDNER